MMNTTIIAIRHGAPRSEGVSDEQLRPLSEEGKAAIKALAEKLRRKRYQPNILLSSPILRAVQTAEVISEIFGVEITETDALGYDFQFKELLKFFPPPEHNKTVVIVGHAPTLAEFVNQMVGTNVLPLGISKGSAAIFTFPRNIHSGSAVFKDYVQP